MHVSFDVIEKVATAVGSMGTLIVAGFAWVRTSRWMHSRNALLMQLKTTEAERDLYKKTSEAWEERFNSINGVIGEMREEFDFKIGHLDRKQSISTQYMCALIIWGRDHRRDGDIPMPEIPEELHDEVTSALERVAHSTMKERTYEQQRD